ncbi:hypothetical protein KPL70_017482 [Citrus sinensis]|nr:hypothetical protein KPL70_017482 [Citrus sinensis]
MVLNIPVKLKLRWEVEYLVLDEADKLFEVGNLLKHYRSCGCAHGVHYISAILNRNTASESIKQKLVFAGSEEGKLLALRQSFAESLNPPVLIFVQSKERAKELYGELAFDDNRAGVIHSDLSQTQLRKSYVNQGNDGGHIRMCLLDCMTYEKKSGHEI